LPPPPLQLLPGGAIQFPGGSFFPAVDQRLFTAHRKIPVTLTSGLFVLIAWFQHQSGSGCSNYGEGKHLASVTLSSSENETMKYRGTTGANGCEYPYSSLQLLRCGPPPHLAKLGFPSFAVTESRDSPRWIDAHSRSTRLNRLNATTVLTVVLIVRTTTTATPNVRAMRAFLDMSLLRVSEAVRFSQTAGARFPLDGEIPLALIGIHCCCNEKMSY
jgi:hypothetical protein